MGKWLTATCEECGEEVHYLSDWDVPRFCKGCLHYEADCEICGRPMQINRTWEHPPRVHKECREAKAAEWEKRTCKECGTTFAVRREWDKKSAYCKDCEWHEISCGLCGRSLRINRNWDKPPTLHRECYDEIRPKDVACSQCGNSFSLSTGLQIKCRSNHWDLPNRCPQCKEDAILIKGASGALRDQFPFPLETTIEKRGFLQTDKVAVVRNRRTGEVVAEVTVANEGFLVNKRVATAIDVRTNDKISKTEHGTQGIFIAKPTADTHNAKTHQMTHRTKTVEKGILFPKKVAETERVAPSEKSEGPTITRVENAPGIMGWLFGKKVYRTDKKE